MIEVELPDGRILEIEAGDDRAAARAAKAFLDKERGVAAPRASGAGLIGFTPSSFMSLPEAEPPPQRPAPDLPLPPQPDPMARQIEEYQGPQTEQTPLSLRGTRIDQGISRLGFVPDRGHELLAETARPLQMDSPESFGGQRITYDEATGLERAGDQLRSGWETFKQGLSLTSAKSMMEALALADRADGGASPVEAPLWAELSPDQRQGLRDRTERALGSAIQSFITSRADQQEFLRNPNVQALAEAVDSGRYRDAWRILSSDFGGIVQQAAVESIPNQILPTVGALVGGLGVGSLGVRLGAFGGGYAADVGPRFVEALSKRMASEGVDGEDGAAVQAWLRGNLGAMREEFQAAQRGAFGPAIADAASFALARGLRPGAGVFRNTMTGLRNMGIEIGTEGAGEAAAGIFAEGKVTPSEVLMEMLGAGPQAVGTTAIATLQEARNMGRTGAQAIEPVPNMTTAGAPSLPPAVEAQPGAQPERGIDRFLGEADFTGLAQPVPGSAGGTGAAAVPPAAPPSGEPPPPPGAADPLGTPPGGAAVPIVTPDNTRPSLEQALNTPAPTPEQQEQQAAQEEAQSEADRASGVQRIAGSLPPGWTVDDEDQIIQVYDPNGMPVMTLVRPPATEQDFAALMTGIAAQNQEGVADGSYPQPNQAPPAPEAPVAPVAPTQPEAPPSAPVAPQAAPTLPQSEAPSQPAPEPPQPPAAPEPPPAQDVLTPRIEGAAKRLNITLAPGDVATVQALMAEEGLSVDAALRRMAQEREAAPEQDSESLTLDEAERILAELEGRARQQEQQAMASGNTPASDARLLQRINDFRALVRQLRQEQQAPASQPEPEAPTPAPAPTGGPAILNAKDRGDFERKLAERGSARVGNVTYGVRQNKNMTGWIWSSRRDNEPVTWDKGPAGASDPWSKEEAIRKAAEWAYPTPIPASQPPAPNVTTPAPTPGNPTDSGAGNVTTPAPNVTTPAPASDLEARKAAAKAKFAAAIKASSQNINAGIDPSVLAAGIELGLIYIEEGVVKFRAWARAVLADAVEMGLDPEAVKPTLKPIYLATSAEVADDVADQMDERAAVRAFDLNTLDQAAGEDNAGTSIQPDGDYGTPAQPNVTGLGRAFARAFLAGQQFATIAQARTFAANLLGGAIDPQSVAAKLLDEAIEAGVVLAAREIVARQGVTDEAKYRTLVGLYEQQPKLAVRTADSIERQAYSTPAPLAFIASRLAQIGPKTTVLEPSAGTGMLLIGANPKSATANEIDADRADVLEMQGFKAGRKDASDTSLNWPQTYGAVIANPPFGAVRDGAGGTKRFDLGHIQPRYVTGEIDHAIALHALEGMRDDGSAVLILGGLAKTIVDPKARADGYNGKAKREFFYVLYNKYNVVDHLTVAGELYQKQGAGWPVDVIVIRGRGKSDKNLPSLGAPRVLSTWDAVGALLNERYDNAKPVAADTGTTPSVVPTGQQSGAGGNPAATGGAGGPNPDGDGVSANPDGSSGVDDRPAAGAGANAGSRPTSAGNGAAGVVDGPTMVAGSDQLGQGSGPSGGQPNVAGLPQSGGGNAGVAGDTGNRPGSREGDSANLSGGVDQAGVSANSQPGIANPNPPDAAAAPVAESRKPRQTDEATEKQVPYEPRADADGIGTLVPVNMRTAVQNALRAAEQRAGMPLVEFVSDRLGYSVEQTRQYFSAEQIDALALGIVNLDKGAGFVIGDQTGVGKGRFVAGMIRYALTRNLIPVFVTEKDNLYKDMARDLTDIGMEGALQQILPTNAGLNLSLGDEGDRQAPRLKTPEAKKHLENLASLSDNQLIGEQKIIFTTYSQMQQQGKGDTPRVKFLQSIAPRSFLILDESHNAGGAGQPEGAMAQALAASSEKKGKRSRGQIFRDFVKSAASVVYSSATWAKRPDVLDLYGAKTDMRLAVASLDGLAEAIRSGGVPMQQIVSAMLADAGQYMRRERTFAGVSYELEKIEVNRKTYDDIATVMQQIFKVSEYVKKTTKGISESIRAEAQAIAGDQAVGAAGAQSTGFGAIMHNLIGQMLLASKAQGTVDLAAAALERGEKPVIALANTMGSFIQEYAEETKASVGDPLNLNFNSLLMRYLDRTLRITIKKPFTEGKAEIRILRPEELGQDGEQLFKETARLIESLDLGAYPVSPIDYLRSQLMERGYKVAEITGREHAVDYRVDGRVHYRKRSSADKTAKGKNRAIDGFNSGSIDVMILNQSGATGLSLHASAKFKDQRKRIMLIAQAEANIDTHMQMLGRVHRTGQVLTPSYLQLVADVPAERRPAAVLAKKMASLSAATTSSRRGTLAAEDTPDFLNEYGDEIVIRMLDDDRSLWVALGEPKLEDENGGTLDVARQVTGRIPMLPLKLQEEVYQRIEDEYRRVIAIADEEGTNRLEAKTLELDARKLEESPWTDAKSTESGSQFAAGSTIGKYSVKRLIPPAPPGMVVQRIADSLGVTLENAKSLDADEAAAQISMLAQQGNIDWKDDKIASVQAQSRRAMEALDDQDLSAKERQLAESRIQGQMDRLTAILREAHPGAFIGVTENGVEDTGLVLAINAPKAGNSNAPSAWEMVALLQSGRRITTALSGVFTPDNRPTDETQLKDRLIIRELAGTVSAPAFFAQLEENAKGRREERYIVTGNLLAAFARREGQIINFYDSEGEIRQGIMFSASFDLDAFEKEQLPRFMSDEAAAYLTDPAIPLTAAVIQTSDGQVQVARNSDNSFVIRVPSSKKEGAVWFLDQRLRPTLASQFVSRGDTMVARIPSSPQRALEAIGLIATGQRLDLVSKATEARAWKKARAASSEGGIGLYANPFDPALFMRLFGRPAARAVRAAAAGMRERNVAAVKANWANTRLPPGVVVEQDAQSQDLLPLWSVLQRPTRMFRKWPAVAALVDQGLAAERRMNNWQTRMNGRMELTLRTLEKQKGDRAKVAAALFDADANEIDIARKDVADKHFAAHDLSPAEATAARELNALVRMSARLVDNHRRATMPKVRQRKREIWNVMNDIMDRASVKSPEYKKLYARRGRLNAKIRNNIGDLATHAAEIESINAQLRMMRAADPVIQNRMAELQTEYDALEARLANTSVQRRVGYFPHKFFGSWRMFKIEGVDEETGEQIRTEITSDQGFYDTEEQAVEAARAYLKADPGAKLRIERKVSLLPSGAGGAVLSDAGYSRLRRGLEEQTGIEGQELSDMLSGVARRRSRRRVFAPGMFRTGAEGFSEDIQRVLRTHISQSVRYVEMDKLKFAYVATTERLGLSPSRAQAIKTEGKAELLRALESWWTDVNGNKQQSEAVVDGLLNKLGLPGSTMAAVAAGAAAMGASNPILAGAFGGYLGFRMYNAIRKGGDFPTRTLMGDLTSDMAHLKLGMLVNIASSVVNLSQTLINTYPVLGEKWTAIGIQRALPAMLSQARNRDKPGMMSADAILLRRADVMTDISIQADAAPLLAEDAGVVKTIKRASMAPFMAAEHFNRAAAFLGALARAEAKGLSPAAAFQEAQAVLKKTQFHQGIADRPELLRVTVLKLPTQFKNFMIQQIGFAFDLAGDTFKNPAPVARFLLGLFLAAGMIGLLPLALADWLLDYGFGVSPIRWMKDRVIRAEIMGDMSGTMADFLMRGLPTLLQMDLSGRVGMGQGFIPNSPADLMQGPFIGTAGRLKELASNNRREIVDYLAALSPAANPLRMLEAGANGASILSAQFWSGDNFQDGKSLVRNPQMRGMPEFNMTDRELITQGLGFRNLRQSLVADAREIDRANRKEGRKDANAYLQEIVQAERNGRPGDIPKIRAEARESGVRLSDKQVAEFRQNARRDRPQRDLENAPIPMRPGMRERLRGIDSRELGPPLAR